MTQAAISREARRMDANERELRCFFAGSESGLRSSFGSFLSMIIAGPPQGGGCTGSAAEDVMIRAIEHVRDTRNARRALQLCTREQQETLCAYYSAGGVTSKRFGHLGPVALMYSFASLAELEAFDERIGLNDGEAKNEAAVIERRAERRLRDACQAYALARASLPKEES